MRKNPPPKALNFKTGNDIINAEGKFMKADYHIHTEFSDDSEYPIEEVVKDAVLLGLDEICFTDHVDYGIKRDPDDPRGIEYRRGGKDEPEIIPLVNTDNRRYAEKISCLREKYKDKISIKLGMEFGIQVSTIPQFETLFSKYPFDFIILSVHQVDNKEFWTQEFQEGKTQKEYNERYYEEILGVIRKYHDYSVLGHLDLIKRYDKAGIYPFEKTKPVITEILKTAIADGKGIEINTSSHRYGLDDLTPSTEILKLYRKLGGRIITIGSDSHKKEHLGAYIDETKKILKELGFTEFCTFEKMNPIFHTL